MDDVKEFSKSIKIKYRERLLRRERQWPPCNESEPVRLKLCYSTDNLLKVNQKGKAIKEVSVEYADLFKTDGTGKKTIRKILVEGDAGIGKTTFCITISEEWADEKILEQFKLLLYLPLCQKTIASATSLPDVLKLLHSSESIRTSVAKHLEEIEGKSTLIIADGWDELSDSEWQEESFLYKLLFGELLPLISVLLTSRPFASAPLHNLQFINRHIKIRGFDNKNIEKYVESQFDTNDKVDCVVEQLKSNPQLESICSIPLNCAILCYMHQIESETLIPSTLTELYKNITLNVINRNIKKLEPGNRILFSSFDSLPERFRESWWRQCEFAYQTLVKSQSVFTEENELVRTCPEGLLSFGLMQSTESHFVFGHGITFHFIHSTFQEFLAALHLERQPPDKKIELCVYIQNPKNFLWCGDSFSVFAPQRVVSTKMRMRKKLYN